MDAEEKDQKENEKPVVETGGDVSGQVAVGNNVVQIGNISGGMVSFQPFAASQPPAEDVGTGRALPRELYARLRSSLLACGPFDNEQRLAALFVQEGLSQWRYDIPEADSAGERVEQIIGWLWPKEAAGENGLVILLRVLAGRYEPPAGCRQQLETLENELQQIIKMFDQGAASGSTG